MIEIGEIDENGVKAVYSYDDKVREHIGFIVKTRANRWLALPPRNRASRMGVFHYNGFKRQRDATKSLDDAHHALN